MSTAEEFKAEGNAALQRGDLSKAIELYTAAINKDGSNAIYYSNRSAAYLKRGNASNALEDAESCIGLNPEFAKGYSRKGAALHGLKRYNDSIKAYEEGLAKFPSDKGLASGLEQVKQEKDGKNRGGMSFPGAGAGAGSLFGPEMIARMAMDPQLRHYLDDADFMAKLKILQNDPNKLGTFLGDKRFMEVFQMMIGAGGMKMKTGEEFKNEMHEPPAPKPKAAEPKKAEPAPMEVEEEENIEDLTPEEIEKLEKKKKALAAKKKGNEFYKKKQFAEALAAYDEAIEIDPLNMTYVANKAAVHFTKKDYDTCIETCKKAFEIGKENRAPFDERARILVRCAKAYHAQGKYAEAIDTIKDAQLESHDKSAERLLKNWELEKRKADTLAYQDDDKAEEAKKRGNDHFRAKEWSEAVKEYEEAIKRAPKNAAIRNNLAAALCKIMDFNGAKSQIDKALELDPKYVKAWVQKGNIEVLMKENHKAMESYRKGLEFDPENKACREGLAKVNSMMMGSNMSEAERKERAAHAMADPEIQSILSDPIIRQVLQDLQDNPRAGQEAMRDPSVSTKIEKLIASGILQTG